MRKGSSFRSPRRKANRRGSVVVLASFMMVVMLVFAAFATDIGYMCLVRTQAQAAADAAALAAGQQMQIRSEDRLRGYFDSTYDSAREVAAKYAALHRLGSANGYLETDEDVVIGRLADPTDRSASMDQSEPSRYNAVTVIVQATAERGRQVPLFFARVFGQEHFDMQATATAAFADRIAGFRTSDDHPTTTLLPFTIQVDDWKAVVENGFEDDWTYDPAAERVRPGSDGVPELKLFPIDSGSGNLGTVNIGTNNNSTGNLARQIREGINSTDLAGYDGVMQLDSATGTMTLTGDPGVSNGIKSAVADAVGQERTMPLYRSAEGTGNGLNYEIVGFAGVRIVDAKLTGANPYILIQPAYVIDPTAISDPGSSESYFVTQPVRLVR